MPELSRFYGIVVAMYWLDHPPPHFHVRYGDATARIEVGSGAVIDGWLPRRALKMVREWEAMHRSELLVNWRLAGVPEPLIPIAPLG